LVSSGEGNGPVIAGAQARARLVTEEVAPVEEAIPGVIMAALTAAAAIPMAAARAADSPATAVAEGAIIEQT
jgi:hypothetical protein